VRTCPSRARDVLLEIASTGAYRPLWSSAILAELDRTLRVLLSKRGVSPDESDAYLTRLLGQMKTTFPDASCSTRSVFIRARS
jgi:hypothetical protein